MAERKITLILTPSEEQVLSILTALACKNDRLLGSLSKEQIEALGRVNGALNALR